jgi:hypothetical protein
LVREWLAAAAGESFIVLATATRATSRNTRLRSTSKALIGSIPSKAPAKETSFKAAGTNLVYVDRVPKDSTLQLHLVDVIDITVGVAEGVDELPHLESDLLGDYVGQDRV